MITDAFLKSMQDPIPTETMERLKTYMISMGADKAQTVASCAKYLKENNNMQALLHVQYALNGEILMKSNDTDDLECDFEKLLNDDASETDGAKK